MKLRAVTLDATGTLIHSPRMAEIYAAVLGRHGIRVEAADVARLFPVVWQELDCRTPPGRDRFAAHPEGARGWWGRLVERLCELLEVQRPSPFVIAELFHRFAQPQAWEIYPDAEPALVLLRRLGLRLGVISNFDERLIDILEGLELAGRFDAVIASVQLGVAKPNPAIFEEALARLGTSPQATLHVGDSPLEDLEGASAAGMKALLLQRDGRHDPADGYPDLLAAARQVEQLLSRRQPRVG